MIIHIINLVEIILYGINHPQHGCILLKIIVFQLKKDLYKLLINSQININNNKNKQYNKNNHK